MISSALKLIACALILQPAFALAADGPDPQSPAEIAAANARVAIDFLGAVNTTRLTRAARLPILRNYGHLDPNKEVPTKLLEEAVVYFDQNQSRFPNRTHITIIDYAKHSNKARFYVINMSTGAVDKHWVIHGWGSDTNDDGLAESFGNVVNSGKSSLGFVRTAEIYSGKFGRSVRLDGLSKTNDKMRERAVVLHGFDEAYERPVKQGLGWGCPALDYAVKDAVIDKVAQGSLMYLGKSN